MTVFRVGGCEYQTVRKYLDIVSRNAYSLVAAGAMVAPETQLLISLLHENGDEMGVDQMRVLIIRLGIELGAAQRAVGVTDRDFQRVKTECATPAGMENVGRRQ